MPEFCEIVDNTIKILNDLKSESICGGFEKQLKNQMLREDDDGLFLNGIEIAESRRGRTIPQELCQFKRKIIEFLTESMKVRLQDEDRDLLLTIKTFLNFDRKADIDKIHELIGKDLSLSAIHLQYMDLSNASVDVKRQPLPEMLKYLSAPSRAEIYSEITIVMARILACTPHSADCESISANYNLKTVKRNGFLIPTENNYLYVHFNMPPLQNWDPRSAIVKWNADMNRRQSNSTGTSAQTTNQPYFKHIFQKASNDFCDVDSDI